MSAANATKKENNKLDELLEQAVSMIVNIKKNEMFKVADLFYGFEWKRIERGTRLLLGRCFLSWANGDGNKTVSLAGKDQLGQQLYKKK